MTELHVLTVGSLRRNPDGTVAEAHSTSTLINTGKFIAVVDTSSRDREPHVRTAMKQIGIRLDEVMYIVHTHPHHDHVGNDGLFKKAKTMEFGPGKPGETLAEPAPGVRIVATPGHTLDSVSVFVETDGMNYAICGDAIPLEDNFRKNIPPGICADEGLAMESLKAVSRFADVVVPGHGGPFTTGRRF